MKTIFSNKSIKVDNNENPDIRTRQRFIYLIQKNEPYGFSYFDKIHEELKAEIGHEYLKCYNDNNEFAVANSTEGFLKKCEAKNLFSAIELFYDLYVMENGNEGTNYVLGLSEEINRIFKESKLPWRLLDGRITKIDSSWIELEIMEEAFSFLNESKFIGALKELNDARDSLIVEDYRSCILNSAKAYESVMKLITGNENGTAKDLIADVMNIGIIPAYHEKFHNAFEEHILNSLAKMRNKEPGASHGRGDKLEDSPESLAQLAYHLSGVLILYLIRRYKEKNSGLSQEDCSHNNELDDYEVPF